MNKIEKEGKNDTADFSGYRGSLQRKKNRTLRPSHEF